MNEESQTVPKKPQQAKLLSLKRQFDHIKRLCWVVSWAPFVECFAFLLVLCPVCACINMLFLCQCLLFSFLVFVCSSDIGINLRCLNTKTHLYLHYVPKEHCKWHFAVHALDCCPWGYCVRWGSRGPGSIHRGPNDQNIATRLQQLGSAAPQEAASHWCCVTSLHNPPGLSHCTDRQFGTHRKHFKRQKISFGPKCLFCLLTVCLRLHLLHERANGAFLWTLPAERNQTASVPKTLTLRPHQQPLKRSNKSLIRPGGWVLVRECIKLK